MVINNQIKRVLKIYYQYARLSTYVNTSEYAIIISAYKTNYLFILSALEQYFKISVEHDASMAATYIKLFKDFKCDSIIHNRLLAILYNNIACYK